jgi:CubicO group peptidase (beta-lactamase class C family)
MIRRSLLALACAFGLSGPAAAQTASQLPADLQVLFWPAERREQDLRRMPELIPHARIEPSPTPRPLPDGEALDFDPSAFMESQRVAGLLVIQDGRVRMERYGLGLTPQDHWDSFSMTKSLTSTLVGAAIADVGDPQPL